MFSFLAFLPIQQNINRYLAWLDSGYHASMAYLASDYHIHARQDPSILFPDVKTIFTIAVPYPNPLSFQKPTDAPRGRIASYAWCRDYHSTMAGVFDQIVGELTEKLGFDFSWRGFTDSAPILERQMGMQAGLGWVGKNSCLIDPVTGSYFFLAEIFTDIPPSKLVDAGIRVDPEPIPDRCGTCTRCIDACPTNCILPDRTIDAGKCISYLTIENKGVIPLDLREKMGDWVFGCDICQMVCPWNRFSLVPSVERTDLFIDPYPLLAGQLNLSDLEFKKQYAESPILRTKRRGWLRNICVAVGNLKDTQAVEPLLYLLNHDPDPLIRSHAVWALGKIATPDALNGIMKVSKTEIDDQVVEECQHSLKNN